MITFYHAPRSRSSRIIWLLEELRVGYDIRPVSIFRPMTGEGSGDPANPHPDKCVPAIVHDGGLVAESIAIVLYLTDAFPAEGLGIGVGDARRGDYLTWLIWYAAEMEPAMMAGLQGELATPMKKRRFDAVVKRIETALAKGPFAMGDAFTSVDLVIVSAVRFARRIFPASAALDAYVARCLARPAALRAETLDDAAGIQQPV